MKKMVLFASLSVLLFSSFTPETGPDQAGCYVQLIGLECVSQEDWTGTDQVYVSLNGAQVTNTARISTGGYIDLTNLDPYYIDGSTSIEVFEYDWDDDDLLVSASMSCSFAGAGEKHVVGTHWTAKYILYYRVY